MNPPSSLAVYSIFTGRKPCLDEYLAEQGKLTFVDTIEHRWGQTSFYIIFERVVGILLKMNDEV